VIDHSTRSWNGVGNISECYWDSYGRGYNQMGRWVESMDAERQTPAAVAGDVVAAWQREILMSMVSDD